MRKLVIFAGGGQALVQNMTIEGGSPVVEEIVLDTLSETEQKAIVASRRRLTLERDETGALIAVRAGRRRVRLSRHG